MTEAPELLPLIRKKVGDYLYPYGAFPDDDYEQPEGYESDYFTPGSDDPLGDRYRTVIMVSAEKLVPLFLDLCALLPEEVHVVLERASEDVYTERDVFVSQAEVDLEQFVEVFKAYEFTLAEDGMLGIGAFGADEPVEIFLADHKEIIVFTPEQEPVFEVLQKHHVSSCRLEYFYELGHTHLALTGYRGLRDPKFDYLHVADALRHIFDMAIQSDDEQNVDPDGNPLGLVPWRAIVVVSRRGGKKSEKQQFLQDFFLTASNRREARELLEARLQSDGYNLESLDELFRIDLANLPPHVQPRSDKLARPIIWYSGDKRAMELPWH